MAERILTFSGTGTLKNWIEPEGLRQSISGALNQLGYGVENVALGVSPSTAAVIAGGVFASQISYQYGFTVRIKSFVGDDPNRSKNVVTGVLSYWFSNVVVSLTGDDTFTQNANGAYQVQSNNNPNVQVGTLGKLDQTLNAVTNAANSASNVISDNAGTIFGISYGIAAVIGLGAVYLLTQRSGGSGYRRY